MRGISNLARGPGPTKYHLPRNLLAFTSNSLHHEFMMTIDAILERIEARPKGRLSVKDALENLQSERADRDARIQIDDSSTQDDS